jgi:hypothetical protein
VVAPVVEPSASSTSGSETERRPSEEPAEMKTETSDEPVTSPDPSQQEPEYEVNISDAELAMIFESVNEHIIGFLERSSPEHSSTPDYILEEITEDFMDTQLAQEALAKELAPAQLVMPVQYANTEEHEPSVHNPVHSPDNSDDWPAGSFLNEIDSNTVSPHYTKLLDWQNVHSRFHIENDIHPIIYSGNRLDFDTTGDSWFAI